MNKAKSKVKALVWTLYSVWTLWLGWYQQKVKEYFLISVLHIDRRWGNVLWDISIEEGGIFEKCFQFWLWIEAGGGEKHWSNYMIKLEKVRKKQVIGRCLSAEHPMVFRAQWPIWVLSVNEIQANCHPGWCGQWKNIQYDLQVIYKIALLSHL